MADMRPSELRLFGIRIDRAASPPVAFHHYRTSDGHGKILPHLQHFSPEIDQLTGAGVKLLIEGEEPIYGYMRNAN